MYGSIAIGFYGSLKYGSIVRVLFPINANPKTTIPKKHMNTNMSICAEAIAKNVCLRDESYISGRTLLEELYRTEAP